MHDPLGIKLRSHHLILLIIPIQKDKIESLKEVIIIEPNIPNYPIVTDECQIPKELSDEELNLMLQKGLLDAKEGKSRSVHDVFHDLRQNMKK